MASLFIALTLLAVFNSFCQTASHRSTLSVTNGGPYGDWHSAVMCPVNYFAIGFSLRVERDQRGGDDSALNGIRLHCAEENHYGVGPTAESHSGSWGEWTSPQYCPRNSVLTGFQLRVEPPAGGGDDTAANNIRFRCSDNTILEGDGMSWGHYGEWSDTCCDGGICGIMPKVEDWQGENGDDTALNDVRFFCCDK